MIIRSWRSFLSLTILTGCFSSPPSHVYILTPPAVAVGGDDRRPVLELRTVSIPDYLDTSDIVSRDGRNEIHVSTTGRWAERLSIGAAAALRAALTQRLPRVQIVRTNPTGPRLLIDIEAFDMQADGRCVLNARWTVPTAAQQSGAATIVTKAPVSGGAISDAAIVTAMTDAVGRLADRIADKIARTPPHQEHPVLDQSAID